jgi:hypothetical protein
MTARSVSIPAIVLSLLAGLLITQAGVLAQGRGRGAGPGPTQAPKAAAPIDLTGYWVSVVTEDWRYRMVTPAKGDYQGVPLTPAARAIADTWDPVKEEASGEPCKSYGAPALLRVPGRLHITWQDDQTLKMESDAGQQTRTFHFGPSTSSGQAPALAGPHTIQGDSVAEWEGGGRGGTDSTLKVTTSSLKAGFLRKNGVPYSENASLTEYFELVTQPDNTPLLVVTIVTTDPQYLRQPFVISSQFKKESSDAKWKPTACSAKW